MTVGQRSGGSVSAPGRAEQMQKSKSRGPSKQAQLFAVEVQEDLGVVCRGVCRWCVWEYVCVREGETAGGKEADGTAGHGRIQRENCRGA
jgi:hypothetical protein